MDSASSAAVVLAAVEEAEDAGQGIDAAGAGEGTGAYFGVQRAWPVVEQRGVAPSTGLPNRVFEAMGLVSLCPGA